MEAKSKLPKLSKLRQPTTNNLLTGVRQNLIKSNAQKVVRRSKSMSDLRSNLFTKSNGQQLSIPKFGGNKNNQPTASRVGIKRQATPATTKIDTGTKPKVIKQAKIPDWDYKSRFNSLLDKYTKLQEDHRKIKEQVAGIEILEEQHNLLLSEHEDLEKSYKKLQKEESKKTEKLIKLENVEKDLNDLKIKYNDLDDYNTKNVSTIQNLTMQNHNLKTSLDSEMSRATQLETSLNKLKEDYIKNDTLRRHLHNTIQDLKGNIRVFCRVRPPVNELENEKLKCLITYPDEMTMEIRKSKESISATSGKPTDFKQDFIFDYVFNEDTSQAEFFEELAQLVQSAIDGYHVCVFAYGQTGSGKTYTMQGLETEEHLGMVPRTINLIFNTIESLSQSNWKYDIKVSFLEIYNENIRDLLDHNANQNLDICFNEGKGTTVKNLSTETILSYNDFEYYMKIAQKNRMVAATDFNEHSSRSHAITKIYLTGQNSESNASYIGSVNLVDLAGSESAKTSHGDRLVETKSINKSLSTLGNVMLALHNKDKHIPYRNSKLTYLLQSCLGGNSKTLMIVNISPFEDHYGESISSLRFASKVKEVKTKIKRNKAIMPPSLKNPQ